MSLVQNERTQLLASALNGAAVGSITAGLIAPIIATVLGLPGTQERFGTIVFVILFWLSAGQNLRMIGQFVLGRLKE